jgi:hypothetical protein
LRLLSLSDHGHDGHFETASATTPAAQACWCCKAAARSAPIGAGAFRALCRAGFEPGGAGISIGAINAGNRRPESASIA